MSDDKSWLKLLNSFLAENNLSADTRVLARALSNDEYGTKHISDMEQALHIERNLDEIGLQPLPTSLTIKLQNINKKNNNVIFNKFTSNWKQTCAIAATITVVSLFNNLTINTQNNNQPTLAEIKHAQEELTLALQYISLAKAKSTYKIKQTFDNNIQQPLNRSLLKPLNHFKETS